MSSLYRCGQYDDLDFSSDADCCACGGGDVAPCFDLDGGDGGAPPLDPWGDGCADYALVPSWCGNYDDDDFSSGALCCACGGGASFSPSAAPSATGAPTRAWGATVYAVDAAVTLAGLACDAFGAEEEAIFLEGVAATLAETAGGAASVGDTAVDGNSDGAGAGATTCEDLDDDRRVVRRRLSDEASTVTIRFSISVDANAVLDDDEIGSGAEAAAAVAAQLASAASSGALASAIAAAAEASGAHGSVSPMADVAVLATAIATRAPSAAPSAPPSLVGVRAIDGGDSAIVTHTLLLVVLAGVLACFFGTVLFTAALCVHLMRGYKGAGGGGAAVPDAAWPRRAPMVQSTQMQSLPATSLFPQQTITTPRGTTKLRVMPVQTVALAPQFHQPNAFHQQPPNTSLFGEPPPKLPNSVFGPTNKLGPPPQQPNNAPNRFAGHPGFAPPMGGEMGGFRPYELPASHAPSQMQQTQMEQQMMGGQQSPTAWRAPLAGVASSPTGGAPPTGYAGCLPPPTTQAAPAQQQPQLLVPTPAIHQWADVPPP